jgi:hypothetical protein
MSSLGSASEGDVFLFSSATLRKQKGDVQADLAIEWGFESVCVIGIFSD